MGITYSIAEIPELLPTSRESINLAIPFAEKLRLRSTENAEPWISLFSIYLKSNIFDLIQESYVQAKDSLISS